MLKFYHIPISANSRRVWIALLEKGIPFEDILLNLNGDQFEPEFLKLNPFHHVPVLVDDDFVVIESLAILDYLEATYPTPSLLPHEPKALAVARMVEMVTVNELLPATIRLTSEAMGITKEPQKAEQAKQKALSVLNFFEGLLADRPYFGSDRLTLADIVAGTMVPGLSDFGVPLNGYPKLKAWTERLASRESWQKTQPNPKIEAFLPRIKTLVKAYLDR